LPGCAAVSECSTSAAAPARSRPSWSNGSGLRPCRPSIRPIRLSWRLERANSAVDVRQAAAEQLPFPDQAFDVSLAQLVVHSMSDPAAGLAEMKRVTHRDGVVAACVWDHGGGQGPLSRFWEAAPELDPEVTGESRLAGSCEGDLAQLVEAAGLREVEETALSVSVEHPSFEEWWEPFTLGVGPAGSYVAGLDAERRAHLREHCRALLPTHRSC
jgi:SAM-dependent methyltransferase